jgi:toxin ParE1/3/4
MLIRWTHAALKDLQTISRRIEQDRNLSTANRVCRTIYDAIQILRRHPQSGKAGVEEGTRELVIPKSPYIVAYRVMGLNAIQILRIWHGAQDRP